jgi:hypothetical protein
MNNLKEIYKQVIKDSYYTEIYGNVDSYIEFSEITAVKKSVKITTDIAIKFAEWLGNKTFHNNTWFNEENHCMDNVTTEELFNDFINNVYEK